jgi:hypothetical protein
MFEYLSVLDFNPITRGDHVLSDLSSAPVSRGLKPFEAKLRK